MSQEPTLPFPTGQSPVEIPCRYCGSRGHRDQAERYCGCKNGASDDPRVARNKQHRQQHADFVFGPLLARLLERRTLVLRFGYRAQAAGARFIAAKYERGDQWDLLYQELIKATKSENRDRNHETFEISWGDGPHRLYVQFSDWTCYMGLELTAF